MNVKINYLDYTCKSFPDVESLKIVDDPDDHTALIFFRSHKGKVSHTRISYDDIVNISVIRKGVKDK